MKKVYLTIMSLAIAAGASAQMQFENPGFEDWDNLTSNEREPAEWNSIKSGGGNASQPSGFVVDRSSTVRPGSSGTYSAMVETKTLTVFGFISVDVNGVMTNGRVEAPTTSPEDGYNRTKPDESDFFTEMTDRPDSLVAWVNYEPQGNDNGRVQCILHTVVGTGLDAGDMGSLPENGGSQGDNTAQTVARAEFDVPANTNGWARISVPFDYLTSDVPQYILLTATSSVVAGGGNPGSKMYVDDFALIYNIATTPAVASVDVTPSTGGALNVDYSTNGTPLSTTDFVVEMSDENGSFASPTVIGTLNTDQATGTIACEVPAGTAAGAGYLVRVNNASQYYEPLSASLEVTNLTVGLTEADASHIRVTNEQNMLTIDLSGSEVEQPQMEVFNLAGQQVMSRSLTAGARNVFATPGAGVYLVRVLHTEGMQTTKLFVR